MSAAAPHRLELAGELTVLTAADHHQQLRSVMAGGAAVQLSLAGVTDLDTAGLQVLLIAKREAERLGTVLTFCDLSQVVRDVLAIAHLDAGFDHDARSGAGLET